MLVLNLFVFRFNRNTDRRSKLISAPTNFNHISHMGPGDGIQNQKLIDLTTNLVDSGEQVVGHHHQQQRVFVTIFVLYYRKLAYTLRLIHACIQVINVV